MDTTKRTVFKKFTKRGVHPDVLCVFISEPPFELRNCHYLGRLWFKWNCRNNNTMDIYLLLRYFACKTTPEEERHVREWNLDDKDGSRAELYRDTHIINQGLVLHSAGQMTPAATHPQNSQTEVEISRDKDS